MTRILAALTLLSTLLAISLPESVLANHGGSESGTVFATVSTGLLALVVDPQNLAYGVRHEGDLFQKPLGQTGDGPADAAFSVTNTGNLSSTWDIFGGDSADWTLDEAPDDETYAHRYDVLPNVDELGNVDGPGSPPHGIPLDPDVSTFLGTGVAPGFTEFVWLQLDMPETTAALGQQSLPITIVATSS